MRQSLGPSRFYMLIFSILFLIPISLFSQESEQQLNQYQEEILRLVEDFEYLDPKYKKDAVMYLQQYLILSANQEALIRSLKSTVS